MVPSLIVTRLQRYAISDPASSIPMLVASSGPLPV